MNTLTDQQKTENPSVSVIVPIYNIQRYLRQCVDSIIHQTLKNIEIILVNDGSTDNCPAMCDTYAKQDKRVRVIHQENGGYGKACNAGFAAARGEYLSIIESDDYAELNMIEHLYGLAKSHDLDIVRCHFFHYNSNANIHTAADLSYVPQNMICSPRDVHQVFFQPPSIWANIYRATMIRENNIYFLETPGASYQDTSFAFKVYACANRFMLTNEVLIHYRTDNEHSSSNSKAKVFCVCDEYNEIERFARDNKMYEKLKDVIVRMRFSAYMWNYDRLEKKNAKLFLKVFSQDMLKCIKSGLISKEKFSKEEIKRINMITYFSLLYHFKQVVLGGKK